MNEKAKVIGGLAGIAVAVFLIILLFVNIINGSDKSNKEITQENVIEQLNEYVKDEVYLKVKENPIKGTVDLEGSSLEEELPDISKYPFKVTGNGDINIEIFSSPEKAGSETSVGKDKSYETWLIEVVEDFNNQEFKIEDKTVSVSLRSVSSGLAADYILSGKYVPDGFTPSNENWGKMLEANGITLNVETNCLVGNVPGMLLTKDTYQQILNDYGSVNIQTITEATQNNEIAMGYTNPYASSTGLNFLVSALYCFDPTNPLSDKAIEGFEQFQANVPVVSYNTTQMEGAIKSGALDGMLMEYQSFINNTNLVGYQFIPFGIRHDNPLYSVGNLSSEKAEAFDIFVDFATNDTNQKLAEEFGFNENDDYVSEIPDTDGKTLLAAQQLYKEKKDNGQEIVAVFIVDTSGSVEGAPLNNMKNSLINAGQYINEENYIGLVTYNSDVTINLPIQKFDLNHRAYFNGEIENLSASGTTSTFHAIAVALQMLEESKVEHPNAKQMIFLLSDGESTSGSVKDIQAFVETMRVPIYTLGYNANIDELKKISSINEAASTNADTEDVVYQIKQLFNTLL